MSRHDGALGAACAARSPDEVTAAHDARAKGHDAEMAKAGYLHPSLGRALLARKGAYARLSRAVLEEPLAYQDGFFAGVILTGGFTTGRTGAEALPELIRIAAPYLSMPGEVATTPLVAVALRVG